jgi:hypothetical protein
LSNIYVNNMTYARKQYSVLLCTRACEEKNGAILSNVGDLNCGGSGWVRGLVVSLPEGEESWLDSAGKLRKRLLQKKLAVSLLWVLLVWCFPWWRALWTLYWQR